MDHRWAILMKFNVALLASIILDLLLFTGHGGVVNCIVNHDLLLTPQHGYHWQRSKRIFYKDSLERDQGLMVQQHVDGTLRPWEHTLKHVTFLTIFANSSKDLGLRMQSYESFQLSPYISVGLRPDTRFGDIVTLAQGRLVHSIGNETHQYQFVEDTCNGVIIFKCSQILHPTSPSMAKADTMAVWLVQRIRHRDTNQRYIYDIRFSIKPIRSLSQINMQRLQLTHNQFEHLKYNDLVGHRKDGESIGSSIEQSISIDHADDELRFRSYIQRLNDYPNSLRRLHHYAYPTAASALATEEEIYDFGKRRQHMYYPATALPSSLTISSPPSAAYNRGNPLNIGEYYRDGKTPVTPSHRHPVDNDRQPERRQKNYILPNLLSLVFGKGPGSAAPSSMASNPSATRSKPFKRTHFDENFGSESNAHRLNEINDHRPPMIRPSPSLVTHHFHHYYYLPPPPSSAASSVNVNEPQNLEGKPMPAQLINLQQLNNNNNNNNNQHQLQHPLANGYSLMNNMKEGDTFLVVPPPTASTVSYFQRPPLPIASSAPMHQIHPVHEQHENDQHRSEKPPPILNYVANQVPLFIYPESVEEPILMRQHHPVLAPSTSVLPPFRKSELDTGAIRYSDPDPIYHGPGNEGVYYPNYNRTDSSMTTKAFKAKSFIKSYQNEFRKLQRGESDWQGREKLSYGANQFRNPGDNNQEHLFRSKTRMKTSGDVLDRNNKSRKNLISKGRLTDIFKANNDSIESEFATELHNDVIETQSPSPSTIEPQSTPEIATSTQSIAKIDRKPPEKHPKTQQTTTNDEKRPEVSIKSRARNPIVNSVVNETITTTTAAMTTTSNPNRRSSEATTTTTSTTSTALGNTLISPRVTRRLKANVRVVSGDEMDYEGSNSNNDYDRKKISVTPANEDLLPTPTPATPLIITSTIKPLEKAVLRWKLKRKITDRESFPQRSVSNTMNTNNRTPSKSVGGEATSNATVKSSPSTRNRKQSTFKLNGNESSPKRRNKTMTVDKNNDNYRQTLSVNDGLSISTPKTGGRNSSAEQFPGTQTSDQKDSINRVTVTTTTTTPIAVGKSYEVLTQKSISKSISFKVGGNGEQIVLIHDDATPSHEDSIKTYKKM